ncbi:hypothetical protein SAMN04487996_11812 [Dyadobacter soli]|uniref:Uncharacterized protein n=1 Tax=Dyadobacter soli TaxID=659014 RepID=A0A1G7TQ14_9BACT|nr:hypothetical protein SAMN04487996_11812 [Dyadobacter soli]
MVLKFTLEINFKMFFIAFDQDLLVVFPTKIPKPVVRLRFEDKSNKTSNYQHSIRKGPAGNLPYLVAAIFN